MEIRTKATASAAAFSWVISLITTTTIGEMLLTLGVSKTMWLFAGFCWLGGALCAYLVKDTRGYSMCKIQESFGIGDEQVATNNVIQT